MKQILLKIIKKLILAATDFIKSNEVTKKEKNYTVDESQNDEGMSQLKVHEGLRLKPYKCTANKLTIGYGRNLEDRGITKKEAEYLFNNDIKDFKQRLFNKIPWIESLDTPRQWVLINMAFTIGISGLLKWENTLGYIKECNYELASKEMLNSRWSKQVGKRADQLSEQMKTGDWIAS